MSNINLDLLQSTKTPPAWPKGLLIFAIAVFLIVGSLGAGLKYFWLAQQKNKLAALEKNFQELRAAFPLEKEQEVVKFEKKLKILQHLLANHSSFTQLMGVMEQLTHPQIYYKSWSYNRRKNSLVVEGVAKNQEFLSQAVNGLINHPEEIKAVIIKDTKTSPDKTTVFHLEIIFQPAVGKFQINTATSSSDFSSEESSNSF